MPIITILFIVLLNSPIAVQAKAWSSSDLVFSRPARALAPGETGIRFSTRVEDYQERFSTTGQRVKITPHAKDRRFNDGEVSQINYEAKITRTWFVPQWMYGVSPTLSAAAQVPLVLTDYERIYLGEGQQDSQKTARLDHVAFLLKKQIFKSKNTQILALQRTKFPSFTSEEAEIEAQHLRPSEGYILGLAAAVESKLKHEWQTAWVVNYDYTLNDKFRDTRVGSRPISRNPGDEIQMRAEISRQYFKKVATEISVLWGHKFKDEYSSWPQEPLAGESQSATQVVSEAGLGYVWPQANEFANNYSSKIKYQKALRGRNAEDISAFGLSIEVIF